jgi:hypothetical protein
MMKLHTDGLLESLDFESFDVCEPCLIGKLTKTPFSGIMEWASDLLEIIHTDEHFDAWWISLFPNLH